MHRNLCENWFHVKADEDVILCDCELTEAAHSVVSFVYGMLGVGWLGEVFCVGIW
jgi:hypothetical protein